MGQPTDWDKVVYAFCYYGHFMTEHELRTYRHLVGVLKASNGRTDQVAELELPRVLFYFRDMLFRMILRY
jgi:hypothetical protein